MNNNPNGIDVVYVRERITELRKQKGVSEYQMSLELGHAKSYIQNIMTGKALPPLREFFKICTYLGVTPKEFFDVKQEQEQRDAVVQTPTLFNQAVDKMRAFDEVGIKTLLEAMNAVKEKRDGFDGFDGFEGCSDFAPN